MALKCFKECPKKSDFNCLLVPFYRNIKANGFAPCHMSYGAILFNAKLGKAQVGPKYNIKT